MGVHVRLGGGGGRHEGGNNGGSGVPKQFFVLSLSYLFFCAYFQNQNQKKN